MLPLNLYARVRISLCSLHTRPRVQRAPGLPCALDFKGRKFLENLAQIMRRDREAVLESVWMAGLDEALKKPRKTANISKRAVDFASPDAKSYSDAERLVEGVACLYVLCFYRRLEGSHEAF